VGNAAVAAWVRAGAVTLDGARVDAFATAAGSILRTSSPAATYCGLGLVLRVCESAELRIEHLLFAPERPRPIVFARVCLQSLAEELLLVSYSELWDLPCRSRSAEEGASSGETERGVRVLADLDAVIRGRAPQGLECGLALDVRVPLPPGERRALAFAYVLPAAAERPGPLVGAWRGDVEAELERARAVRRARFAGCAHPLAAYRAQFAPDA
jgi:hypothetical protein